MEKQKLFALLTIITFTALITTSAVCNQCSLGTGLNEEITNAGESIENDDVGNEDKTGQDKSSTKDQQDQDKSKSKDSSGDKSNGGPTIKLVISEGPSYSPADDVCYYVIEAIVTGNPTPKVDFSKDDSKGTLGDFKAQVNIKRNETYTLTADATNQNGTQSASIDLSWACNGGSQKSGGQNSPPVINDINISDAVIFPDVDYSVTVDAADPDGDKLYYQWSVSAGSISDPGTNPTDWHTPADVGIYTITVAVTDNINPVVTKSKEFMVEPSMGGALPDNNIPIVISESGYIEQKIIAYDNTDRFVLGDDSNQRGYQSFLSFDISGLAGTTIRSATLSGTPARENGNPMQDFQYFSIVIANWGERPIELSDYNLPGSILQSVSSSSFTISGEALKREIQNTINNGKSRFQLTLRFSVDSDLDDEFDFIEYTPKVLSLEVDY